MVLLIVQFWDNEILKLKVRSESLVWW